MSTSLLQFKVDEEFVSVPKSDVVKTEIKTRTPPIIGIQRGITWNVEDFEKLQQYMHDIRLYKWFSDYDSAFKLTAYLNIFIRKTYNDHRPTMLYKTKVEAIDAGIADNKIMADGIIGIINTLANQSFSFYDYMSMGTSVVPETIGQKKLLTEIVRLSVLKDGGMAARGNAWNHVGNFGYGVPTAKYYEFGIHNSPNDDALMLSRSVLKDGLQQYQNDSFLTASHTAIFIPK
jgi:hypothetical protein